MRPDGFAARALRVCGVVMAVVVSVRTELQQFARQLDAMGRGQLRFAAAQALNISTQAAKDKLRAEMASTFDRPTSWTLNSTYLQRASTRSLVADVHFKDFAPKGVPAGKFLKPEILGGERRLKAAEIKLNNALGTTGLRWVPTKFTQLDAYGNPSRGQIVTILTRLAPGTLGLGSANSGKGKRRDESYFAILPNAKQGRGGRGGGLPPGIYKQTVGGLGRRFQPVMTFARHSPEYRQRLDFTGVAAAAFKARFPSALREAMAKAMRSARARAGQGGGRRGMVGV